MENIMDFTGFSPICPVPSKLKSKVAPQVLLIIEFIGNAVRKSY